MTAARKRTWSSVEVTDHATGKAKSTPVDAFGTAAVVIELCDALAIEFFDGMRVLDGGGELSASGKSVRLVA